MNIITKFNDINDELSSFSMSIKGITTIGKLIEISIDKFNEYFRIKRMNIMILNNPKNMELRPSKKNGQPKMDLPSIDSECFVCDTKLNQFTMLYKEEDLIRVNDKKKSFSCRKCLIL